MVTFPMPKVGMTKASALSSTRQYAWLRSKLNASSMTTRGVPLSSGMSFLLTPPPEATQRVFRPVKRCCAAVRSDCALADVVWSDASCASSSPARARAWSRCGASAAYVAPPAIAAGTTTAGMNRRSLRFIRGFLAAPGGTREHKVGILGQVDLRHRPRAGVDGGDEGLAVGDGVDRATAGQDRGDLGVGAHLHLL